MVVVYRHFITTDMTLDFRLNQRTVTSRLYHIIVRNKTLRRGIDDEQDKLTHGTSSSSLIVAGFYFSSVGRMLRSTDVAGGGNRN